MNEEETKLIQAGAQAAMQPFSNLIEKLFGGAAEEIGGMWKDGWAARRKIRQAKLMDRVDAALKARNIEPHRIPDYIWVPALNAALQQDDETLQQKWANLLTSAAGPEAERVLPCFPTILAELSSQQARFLDVIHEKSFAFVGNNKKLVHSTHKWFDLMILHEPVKSSWSSLEIDVDALLRLRLIEESIYYAESEDILKGKDVVQQNEWVLTNLGVAFIEACRTESITAKSLSAERLA